MDTKPYRRHHRRQQKQEAILACWWLSSETSWLDSFEMHRMEYCYYCSPIFEYSNTKVVFESCWCYSNTSSHLRCNNARRFAEERNTAKTQKCRLGLYMIFTVYSLRLSTCKPNCHTVSNWLRNSYAVQFYSSIKQDLVRPYDIKHSSKIGGLSGY